jgi:hypothetical protein
MAYQPSLNDVKDLMPQSSGYKPSLSDVQDLLPQNNSDLAKTLALTQNSPWGLEMNMAASSPVQTNIANNIAQGASNAVTQPVNLGIRGINAGLNKNIPLINPTISGIKTDPTAVNASTAVLSSLPFILSDGAINPYLGYLGKVGMGTATGVSQGALSAANNPNASIGFNSLLGGFLGLGGAALGNAVSSFAKSKGAQSAMEGSDINTPSQAADILATAKANGMNPDIGTVMNSEGASNLYNDVLGSVPFSGVGTQQKNIIGKAKSMATNIMNGFKGSSAPGDIGDDLKTAVAANMETATANNKQMFSGPDGVFTQSDAQGLNMSPSEFPNTAAVAAKLLNGKKSILGITPTVPEEQLQRLQGIIASNPIAGTTGNNHIVNLGGVLPDDIDSALNSADVNHAPDQTGATAVSIPTDPDSLPLSNIHSEISDIGDEARQAAQTGDMKTASFYTSIKNAMTQDLNNKMASIPGLGDDYAAAKQDFAKNVAPYRQQQLLNIINNKTDSNLLPGLLTKTNNQKIFQDLDEGSQNKVIFSALKNAAKIDQDGSLQYSPMGVVEGYKNLQKNLPSYIINDKANQQLSDLSKVNNIYKTANANINSPLTAFGVMKRFGPYIGAAGLGVGAHALGGSIPEDIAASIGIPLAARIAGKTLRSNALANTYANPGSGSNGILRHPLISAILNQKQGGSQ